MKVRILEPAFFNSIYLNKGEIVDLNIDECPSWAEVIGEKPKAKEPEQKEENTENKEAGKSSETAYTRPNGCHRAICRAGAAGAAGGRALPAL